MKIAFGGVETGYGPGVVVALDGDEVATAIMAYLTAHGVHVNGPRTIRVNDALCEIGTIYVDPSGSVNTKAARWSGRGEMEI